MPFGWIDADNPILGQIDAAATRYGVPRDLAHVVAQMESQYNPQADSGKAQGVMQLTPATGTALGVGNRFDSAQNIDAGVRLLGSLLRKYGGDTRLTLAAYNAGEGNVDRAGRNVPNFPETQAYVQKGMSLLYPGMKTDAKAAPTGDEFGWVEAPATPAAKPAFIAPPGSALSRVGSNIWDTAVTGIGKMLTTNPYDMFRDAAVQHIMQAAEAVDAYKRGDWSALGHVAGAAVPFIGPGLVAAAEVMGGEAPVFDKYGNVVRQGREPDIASGAGQMIGLAGPAFVGDVANLGGKVADVVVPAATEAAARTGAAAVDVVGGVNPAVRDAIGVISPRAKNILNTAARIKQAKDAFVAAREAAAAPEAAAPAPPTPPAPVSLGEAFAKSQGLDWASLSPADQMVLEHTARAQANAAAAPPPRPAYTPPPEPPVAAPPAPSKTIAEMIQEEIAAKKAAEGWPEGWAERRKSLDAEMIQEEIAAKKAAQAPPEEPPAAPPVAPAAAAASVPEPPLPEAPVSAVAARPAAAQAAADLEAAMRPDRLTDFLVANKIPGAMIDQFGPKEWQMVADQARTMPPTADDIAAVRAKIGEYEGAASMPAEAAKASPAEAAAEFETRKATRTRRKPAAAAPAPAAAAAAPPAAVPPTFAPGVNPAEELARLMPEHAVEPPPAGPRAPTASELRVEVLAKALAAGDIPTSELARLPQITDAELLLEDLARAHGEARPTAAELPQIVDRVRELRGEPKALAKGEGEAAYQEQQGRIEPPTAGAAAEAPKAEAVAAGAETVPTPTPKPEPEAPLAPTTEPRVQSVEFGPEKTVSGKREFTARGIDAEGNGISVVKIRQSPYGGYTVERSYYEKPPGPENRYGRQKTEQIGDVYSKSEARDVAEAFLKGEAHPFASAEAGQPISEYTPGSGKLKPPEASRSNENGGWMHGTVDGEPAWTDGHVAFKGDVPGKATGAEVPMQKIWDHAIQDATSEYKPIGTFRKNQIDHVVLANDNGQTITLDGKFFDFANKRYPGATFKGPAEGAKGGVAVWSGGQEPKMVGVIMPFRYATNELPASLQTLAEQSATASQSLRDMVVKPRRARKK